jgi:hypothetical protein
MIALQSGGAVPLTAITTNVPIAIANEAVSANVHSSATGDYFVQRARQGGTYPGLTPSLEDRGDPNNLSPVPSTPGGGFMGRLKNLGKMTAGKKPQEAGVNVGSPVVPENRTIVEVSVGVDFVGGSIHVAM